MKNKPFLSICITSYNRVSELMRCLESIDSKKVDQIEVIISEDCSPRKNEIKESVSNFAHDSLYKIIFNSNENNLGYDRNLGKLIQLANGEYIVFMSDDDFFIEKAIDILIDKLSFNKCAVAFTPFFYEIDNEYKRMFKKDFVIEPNIENTSRFLYSSILFSGLVFERNKVVNYDAARFENLIYFQVYLFISTLYKHGGCYFHVPLVRAVEDGENGFGISESSNKIDLLADRDSIFSNLAFHKGLIKVIKIFDAENGTKIIEKFAKEYSLRMYYGLSKARKIGKKELKQYWEMSCELDIKLSFVTKIYYLTLMIFGSKFCDFSYSFPSKCLLSIRKIKKIS